MLLFRLPLSVPPPVRTRSVSDSRAQLGRVTRALAGHTENLTRICSKPPTQQNTGPRPRTAPPCAKRRGGAGGGAGGRAAPSSGAGPARPKGGPTPPPAKAPPPTASTPPPPPPAPAAKQEEEKEEEEVMKLHEELLEQVRNGERG